MGSLTMLNCTIYSNVADRDGGGIYTLWQDSSLTLEHVTIGNNQAGWGAEGGEGGGLWADGPVTLKNSVLAGNEAYQHPDCASGGNANFTSEDYNAIENLGCSIENAGHDRLGLPIGLPPYFGANGGPTKTLALYPASILVNRIPVANSTVDTDQRGVLRPTLSPEEEDSPCRDIGAYGSMGGY